MSTRAEQPYSITLRDEIAMRMAVALVALPAFAAAGKEILAVTAYAVADAMMEARVA